MIQEILQAFIFIFIAEMGDKTQILAMAFATKYPVKKVLLGIMLGAFLNHGIAVVLGSQLTKLVPMSMVQLVAGIAFIIFGIWSLRLEDEEEEATMTAKHGPILTVALAFFIGEMGDKTQLTAIALAAQSFMPALILLGTVSGMVVTGGLGIFVGKKIGNRVPEIAIKTVASIIFLLFGAIKIYGAMPPMYLNAITISLFIVPLVAVFCFLFLKNYKVYQSGEMTKYRRVSGELYQYYLDMEHKVNKLCKGQASCGSCDGTRCPVGNTRAIIESSIQKEVVHLEEVDKQLIAGKKFETEGIDQIIEATETMLEKAEPEQKEALDRIIDNMKSIQNKSNRPKE